MSSSKDDLTKMLMEVVKAIDEADVPDDLREAAFNKAFEVLAGGAAPSGPVAGGVRGVSGTSGLGGAQSADERSVQADGPSLGRVASRLSLDPDLVDEIYYAEGDDLNLALAASRLDKGKASATQQIALLVAAGRQAGGWDEWTETGRFRDVAREYGRFDQANFASTIRRMGDVFSFRGRGRSVEVRVTRPGFEAAANLARQLAGE